MRLVGTIVGVLVLVGCSAADPPAVVAPRTEGAVAAGVFAGLGAGPFDAAGEPTVDGRRVLDVLTIQGALLRAHARDGRYPGTLDGLAPEFVSAVPRDPESGAPYGYRPAGDGQAYEISAGLSNGQVFAGVPNG